ncbi:autotransporter domain-containing protein [Brucella anthropi]|nr:autotransporter domain-containing protein [Brucella anthropi]KAB2744609.1 autotransporter domain-containing protein [Brucella anthropi]KAB2774638.1 autotransporter domain-containing protein [Brucella anthropi]
MLIVVMCVQVQVARRYRQIRGLIMYKTTVHKMRSLLQNTTALVGIRYWSVAAAIVMCPALSVQTARAEFVWTGTTGGWNSPAFWSSGSIPDSAGAEVTFNGMSDGITYYVGLDGGPYTVGTLNINNSVLGGYAFQNGTLTLNSGTTDDARIIVTRRNHTPIFQSTAVLNLASDVTVDTVGANAEMSVAGKIFGTHKLTKTGAGTVTLYGASAGSMFSDIDVTGGTLALLGAGDVGSTTLSVRNGTLQTDGAALASGATVNVGANGAFDVLIGNETIRELQQTGGTVSGRTGTTVNISGHYNQTDGTTGRNITLNAGTFTQKRGVIAKDTTVNVAGKTILSGGEINGVLNLSGDASVLQDSKTTVRGELSASAPATLTVKDTLAFDRATSRNVSYNLEGGVISAIADMLLSTGTISLLSGQSGTLAAAAGATLNIMTGFKAEDGSVLTLGSAADTGTVFLSFRNASRSGAAGQETHVAGGTVKIGSLLAGKTALGIDTNSTLPVRVAIAKDAVVDVNGFGTNLTALSGSGTVTNSAPNSAVITANGNVNSVFAGVIENGSGGLSLIKDGTGTLALTGDNTYTGGTDIKTGTLQIGDGGTTGSLAGDIHNSAALAFNRSGILTLAGAISGNGSLLQSGTGITILTGNSSAFTGETSVSKGTLQIAGKLGSSAGHIDAGTTSGATANLRVTGTDARWLIDGNLSIGGAGNGGLVIDQGGIVTNSFGDVKGVSGEPATAVVNGRGSRWDNRAALLAGVDGHGEVYVLNGATLTSTDGHIGRSLNGAAGEGLVVVSGTGSNWSNAGTLRVGDMGGKGTLRITNGGIVTNGDSFIGSMTNSTGSVIVEGSGSRWINTGDLNIGFGTPFNYGSGSVSITMGAVVEAGADGKGTVYLAKDGLFPGFGSTGTLSIGADSNDAAKAAVAGRLKAGLLEFGKGTATLRFNHTDSNYVFDTRMKSGNTGSINQIAGTTVLTADNTDFRGMTTVSGGKLIVQGTLGGSAAVTGGTLQFGGGAQSTINSLSGDLNVSGAGSKLAIAGSSSLWVSNTIDLQDQTQLAINAGAGQPSLESDRMRIGNGVAFNLSGIQNESQLEKVLISTRNGISGDFSAVTIGGFNGTVDYMTVHTRKSDDETKYLASYGLSWTAGNNLAHGTFTLANATDHFTVGTALADQVMNVVSGWDGTSLTKAGDGTLLLTGTNTYSGGTTIQGGVLQLGNGGITGSVLGDITNNAALAFNRSDSFAFSNVISGTGRVEQRGSGTLILSGINTYTGGTSIAGGILQVSADNNLGAGLGGLTFSGGTLATTAGFDSARAIGLTGNGTFDIAAGTEFGLTGVITGTGDLIKSGAGTLRLENGGNAYGNTLVQSGILTGDAGSLSGHIGNAATMIFDQNVAGTFAGNIAGLDGVEGRMEKRGAGTLTLAGTSVLDWTIAGGELITAADRFGGNAEIASGTSLHFDGSHAGHYAGVLSGSGRFALDGTGTVLLTGDSSGFTGTTTLNAGTLLVGNANGTGHLGGSLDVLAGARLGGSGTIGSGTGSLVRVASGATIAPGNSIDTLTIDGNLTFEAGSTLEAEINPALESDLITVTGQANINGGTVYALKAGGVYLPESRWTIVTVVGGVTGVFNNLDQNMPFVDLALSYDRNHVYIDAKRNAVAFCDVAVTSNQCATGNGIESIGVGNTVYDLVASLTDETSARQAFDALSGEIHASAKTALIEDSRFIRNAANDRLRAAFGDAGASTAPVLAYVSQSDPVAVAATHSGPVFWTQAFGSWGSADSDGNARGMGRNTGGLLIGADTMLDYWRAGMLSGYSHSRIKGDTGSGSASSDNYHLGLYAGTNWSNVNFRSGIAYTYHNVDAGRFVAIPGLNEQLKADYSAGTFQTFSELGYDIRLKNGMRLEPFANLAHVSLHTNGLSETGGAAALNSPSSNTNMTFTTLGLRGEQIVTLGEMKATLRGMAGWRHAINGTVPEVVFAFSDGDNFTIAGVPLAKDSASIEAGLDIDVTSSVTLGLSYTGQYSASSRDHVFNANFEMKF